MNPFFLIGIKVANIASKKLARRTQKIFAPPQIKFHPFLYSCYNVYVGTCLSQNGTCSFLFKSKLFHDIKEHYSNTKNKSSTKRNI